MAPWLLGLLRRGLWYSHCRRGPRWGTSGEASTEKSLQHESLLMPDFI